MVVCPSRSLVLYGGGGANQTTISPSLPHFLVSYPPSFYSIGATRGGVEGSMDHPRVFSTFCQKPVTKVANHSGTAEYRGSGSYMGRGEKGKHTRSRTHAHTRTHTALRMEQERLMLGFILYWRHEPFSRHPVWRHQTNFGHPVKT